MIQNTCLSSCAHHQIAVGEKWVGNAHIPTRALAARPAQGGLGSGLVLPPPGRPPGYLRKHSIGKKARFLLPTSLCWKSTAAGVRNLSPDCTRAPAGRLCQGHHQAPALSAPAPSTLPGVSGKQTGRPGDSSANPNDRPCPASPLGRSMRGTGEVGQHMAASSLSITNTASRAP